MIFRALPNHYIGPILSKFSALQANFEKGVFRHILKIFWAHFENLHFSARAPPNQQYILRPHASLEKPKIDILKQYQRGTLWSAGDIRGVFFPKSAPEPIAVKSELIIAFDWNNSVKSFNPRYRKGGSFPFFSASIEHQLVSTDFTRQAMRTKNVYQILIYSAFKQSDNVIENLASGGEKGPKFYAPRANGTRIFVWWS